MKWLYRMAETIAEATVVLSYTSPGYRIRKNLWDRDALDVSMHGKTCLITGANSGIGFATSIELAKMGAEVLMVCRNTEKGENARQVVQQASTGAKPVLEIADISNMQDVKNLAERIRNRCDRLDVLINNAGVMLHQREESRDGIEMTFATNVLSGFILVKEMKSLLKAAAPSRVIHVTSGGMYTQKLDVEDLLFEKKDYDGVVAYAQTKRAQVILSELWAKELADDGITSNSMHPGWAKTPGVATSLPKFNRILGPILRSSEQGADTVVWLAASPQAIGESGKLFFDRKSRRTHVASKTHSSENDKRKLWDFCEKCYRSN